MDVEAYKEMLQGWVANFVDLRMSRYTAVTEQDLNEMLGAIDVGSLDDLFADIPAAATCPPGSGKRSTCRTAALAQEVYEHLSALAARGVHADAEVNFLGAGMYDHYVPALIDPRCWAARVPRPTRPTSPVSGRAADHVRYRPLSRS